MSRSQEQKLRSWFVMSMTFDIFQVVSGQCVIYTFWPSELFMSAFGLYLVLIEFLTPLFILIYCYGRIVWVLSRRIDSRFNSDNLTDKFQTARENTIKTFLLINVCFVICWSSEQAYYFMFNLGYHADFNGMFYKVSVVMAFCNCTINPFVYLVKYRDYQIALKEFFSLHVVKGYDTSEVNHSINTVTLSSTCGNNEVLPKAP